MVPRGVAVWEISTWQINEKKQTTLIDVFATMWDVRPVVMNWFLYDGVIWQNQNQNCLLLTSMKLSLDM